MKSTEKKDIFAGVDVDGIIKETLKAHIAKENAALPSLETVNESFVAEPKQFKQVTEFVSQKTKTAHVEKYKGYIDSFNRVSSELDTANRSDVNCRHSEFRSLKMDETWNLNAVWLHELYFANCFDPHSEVVMDSVAFLRLQRDFGTFDDWQRDFMACALASRGGWAVCGYHLFLKKYVNFLVDDHAGSIPMGFYPLVVVDMWEHAYYRDYLNDPKSYLISQMREFNWTVIEERFKKAESIAQVVK
jgi:superoxide dismutase, Fe-Mn family